MYILQKLKQMKIWLCWNYIDVNGKKTKKPVAADGGTTGTNSEYQNTWATCDEAVSAKERMNADGIGFVIPRGYFFLDIDHKEIENPFIQMMLKRFDSYAEISPSGNGLHIYGMADMARLPVIQNKDGKQKLDRQFYMKNPNNGTELYIGGLTNRFATFTGNAIQDIPLCECTEAVLTTLDKDMRRSQPKNYSSKRDGDRETFDIICNLRRQKNGAKFVKLFDKGDFSDYGSQSEADLALCTMLAFRTGNNPEMIDTLFRQSALYRSKWNRTDYREMTIAKSVEACGGQFHKSVMPHPEWVSCNEKGILRISATKLAKAVKSMVKYILVRDSGKEGVRVYIYEKGVYVYYAPDMFRAVIKNIIAEYDEDIVSMGAVHETYAILITDLDYTPESALNAREDIINFQNGLLVVTATDIHLIPHTPDILTTIQIPCNYTDKMIPTPAFDRYLHTLTDGNRDVQQLLLEFMGVVLSNIKGYRMKKSLFLVGAGDTGKSVLKSLTERLIGRGNFIGIDLKEIEARFGTGAIYGTRLAGSSDMSFLSVDELKTFKKITGGDSLFAEFKGQQAVEFTYDGLLWFCMNRLPKFGGDDGKWVYDRIMVVECKNVIPPEKQDKQLSDKLYAERDGIVRKAVLTVQNVIRSGYRFSEPKSVTVAREQYMSDNNTVISFWNECMVQRNRISDKATVGKIYDVYKAWCQDNNSGYAKSAKEFRSIISEYLNTSYSNLTVRSKAGIVYRNYTLSVDTKQQYCRIYGYDEILW